MMDLDNCTIILASRAHKNYGQLNNITDIVYHPQMNSSDEMSFTVHKQNNTNLWDKIDDLRLIYVKELNEYFQIEVTVTDGLEDTKKVTATSQCEAELSQTNLYNLEINTEIDIERDAYIPTILYNPDKPQGSLLHRVLEKTPHYSIGHVDASISNIQRTFSADNTDIYSFLTNTVAKEINCMFTFDSVQRKVNAYDLYTVCEDCGYRGDYIDRCPECGSTNLHSYGEDTTILVSVDNLTDEITYSTNVGAIKNCFRLVAGDDDMTTAVISCNPNGSDYIYYFSEEQKADMPEELVEKLNSYDALMKEYEPEYVQLSQDIYNTIDAILYYRSGMMPTIEDYTVTAATEAAKLTVQNLNPLSLPVLNQYTSVDTVNSALKNYATVFVKTGYVKIEIDSGVWDFSKKIWKGRFKVTNYSDKEDVAYSDELIIDVNNDYENFIREKIMKNIKDDDNSYIYEVLKIDDLDKFKIALTYYSLTRLQSFADAIQGAIDVLVDEGQCYKDALYYDTFYTPYYNRLVACQAEMDVRSATVQEYEKQYEQLIERRDEIQKILDFEKYIGEDLFKIFCAYRREDTYQNDNYISDGLETTEIFAKAMEFIENAKKEIVKSGEHQHTISANINNLMKIPQFAPLLDKFELGNWIRFRVEDNLYRLRLVDYEQSQGNPKNINTNFSDLTKIYNGVSDLESILNSAQSVASSYQYYANQASQGEKAYSEFDELNKNGLNSALIAIRNRDSEEVTIDKHGALFRSYDDISDSYSPKQMRIVSNELVMTEDNWESASLAIGEHQFTFFDKADETFKNGTGYGVSAKFLNAPYIYGGQIIASELYSTNYSPTTGSFFNFKDGTFSLADGKIAFDGKKLTTHIEEIENTVSKNGIIAAINMSPEKIDIDADKINLNGAVTANNYFKINHDGSMETISGKIGGWNIDDTGIYSAQEGLVSGIYGASDSSGYFLSIKQTDSEGGEYYPFRVWNNGLLEARGVKIDGDLACDGNKTLTAKNIKVEGNTLILTIPDLVIEGGEPVTYRGSDLSWTQGYYTLCEEKSISVDKGSGCMVIYCKKEDTYASAANNALTQVLMRGCSAISIEFKVDAELDYIGSISVNGVPKTVKVSDGWRTLTWNNISASYADIQVGIGAASAYWPCTGYIRKIEVFD